MCLSSAAEEFSLAPYSPSTFVPSARMAATPATPPVSLSLQRAKQLWEAYQAYEASYSPELATIYADEATVQIQHQRGNGPSLTEIIPAGQYQQSIRQLMSVAKSSGDCSLYENVRFVEKGSWVIVQATRVDGRGGYRVPHWLTILPDSTSPLGGHVVAEVAVIQEAQ
ncbi:MAG: hypothetical protein QE263_09330 [Vampirovibrionales bacterium]|nr:hypothetical protein [Vampirovibrionales bacterium]